jgi:hypothetical protein
MATRTSRLSAALGAAIFLTACWSAASACCPAPSSGSFAINADQTVVILWDAARKTQHFIRQASFKSDADDFGFLIPSPSLPELAESGNDAFPYLATLTRPPIEYRQQRQYTGCACAAENKVASAPGGVNVLHEQRVAGFDAVVLDASSADALTAWLKDHGYAYSPEIKAWAEPYVAQGWKITALKVAKKDDAAADDKTVAASALRMSFATDAPLFPYREPDYGSAVKPGSSRTLRIYFLAESRYGGAMGSSQWSGRPVWSDMLTKSQRDELLTKLNLPADTGPAEMRLTEFEDDWAYRVAPADVEFTVAAEQDKLHRKPVVMYVQSTSPLPEDATAYLIAAAVVMTPIWRRRWKKLGRDVTAG